MLQCTNALLDAIQSVPEILLERSYDRSTGKEENKQSTEGREPHKR
jgi:hypothetical protein